MRPMCERFFRLYLDGCVPCTSRTSRSISRTRITSAGVGGGKKQSGTHLVIVLDAHDDSVLFRTKTTRAQYPKMTTRSPIGGVLEPLTRRLSRRCKVIQVCLHGAVFLQLKEPILHYIFKRHHSVGRL